MLENDQRKHKCTVIYTGHTTPKKDIIFSFPRPFRLLVFCLDGCRCRLGEAAERRNAGPLHGAQVELVGVVKVDRTQRAALGRRADAAAGHGVGVAGKGLTVRSERVGVAGEGRGDVDAGVEGIDGVVAGAGSICASAKKELRTLISRMFILFLQKEDGEDLHHQIPA